MIYDRTVRLVAIGMSSCSSSSYRITHTLTRERDAWDGRTGRAGARPYRMLIRQNRGFASY
jgi:hypothetical protein